MPLAYEEFFRHEEEIAEGRCNHTRKGMGLQPATGDEDCKTEPCNWKCSFLQFMKKVKNGE